MKIDILDPKTDGMKELRNHRGRTGVSQYTVAERMEVGQSRISHLEKQDAAIMRLHILKKYVEAMGGTITVTVELPDMGGEDAS